MSGDTAPAGWACSSPHTPVTYCLPLCFVITQEGLILGVLMLASSLQGQGGHLWTFLNISISAFL